MQDHVVSVSDADFDRQVLRSEVPVLVDFTAAWCAPCRALAPVLEELAARQAGQLKVVSLDVDVSQATAERFGVRAMPTLLFFKGGQVARQLLGAVPRRTLDGVVRELLAPAAAGAR